MNRLVNRCFRLLVILLMTVYSFIGHTEEVDLKKEFCHKVNKRFKEFKWKRIVCNPERWEVYGVSSNGNPIFFQKFGFDDIRNTAPVSLVLCSIHGDEANGAYACFHLVRDLVYGNNEVLKKTRIVVAPIVNPDGFLSGARTNARGVDINRNLPTKDWESSSKKVWNNYRNDPNKYPGEKANSEIESQFQVELIKRYNPDKIIAIHAPYGFIDIDGPGDTKYYGAVQLSKRARLVALDMQAESKQFLKLVDFRFFPGSLGNYAGNERKIPTYTIELPATDTGKADYYWSILRRPLLKALSTKINVGPG